jgi:hypothetical protein
MLFLSLSMFFAIKKKIFPIFIFLYYFSFK